MPSKLPRTDVQRIFDALPTRFQSSVVGNVYQQIIQQLNAEGLAPLEPLVALLFPDVAPAQARRELSTRYINRPPKAADGRVLLQLCVSRANAQTGAGNTVWFEAEAALNPADFTPDNARYASETFVDMQATRATGKQIEQTVEASRILPEPTRTPSASLKLAMAENVLGDYAERRTLHGLRGGVDSHQFEDTDARRTDGIAAGHETALKDVGESVNCLEAMLQWALANGKQRYRLLAMLGDYGTGKTSHCFQFARVLNGEVAHEAWAQSKPGAENPGALYIDLAELAGITSLVELSLPDILTVVLNKAAAGEGAVKDDDVQALIQRARAGTLVMVFDGLDELLKNDRSVLHKVFDQLLKVLEPSKAQREKGQPSLARVIVSCRTHYFRDVEDQHGFFNTRQRGVAKAGDYLCLSLLPWTADNITSYLGKRLPEAQAAELLNIIQTTYNLQELASRPVLLAMMSEQLGSLLRLRDAGEPIAAARLYEITVSEWVQRDSGKHRLSAQHKAVLMGALAAAMWSDGVEAWSAEQLDRWLLRTVQKLFPNRYAVEQAEAIQDDLRTATFIVRPDAQRFSFAHRSFLEYFLARFVWDALALCEMDALSNADLHALLPTRPLNKEAQQFLKEICANQLRRLGTAEMHKRALPLLRALQKAPEVTPMPTSQRYVIWQLVTAFAASSERTSARPRIASEASPGAAMREIPLNLTALNFVAERWQDRDLSWLPPLDLRGANMLKLRAYRCRFGRVLCDSQTNWGQALLRDCDTAEFEWGDSDQGGLLVRSSPAKSSIPAVLRAKIALAGPWTLPIHLARVTSVAFHPDGHKVLSGMGDSAHLWDCASGRELCRFGENGEDRDQVRSLAFNPNGLEMLTGSRDGTVSLWDCATGKELSRFQCHSESVHSAAFHPGGQQVLTGGNDAMARLWDLSTGKELRCFEGHRKGINSVAFHPQGHQVLTGGDDDTARLWDFATGHELIQFIRHRAPVKSVAFNPVIHQVVTAGCDLAVWLWNSDTGKELRRFDGHRDLVNGMAFHPQGHQLLSGSADRTARLWDCVTGKELQCFEGHTDIIRSVAFHPEGNLVLTGSEDNTARLWDCATGRELRRFQGHGGIFSNSGFRTPGRSTPIGSSDVRVVVHNLPGTSIVTFDAKGNLLDWDDEAIDTWLFTLANGVPEPLEMAPRLQL